MFRSEHSEHIPLDMVTCRMCADMEGSWVHDTYPNTRDSAEAGQPKTETSS